MRRQKKLNWILMIVLLFRRIFSSNYCAWLSFSTCSCEVLRTWNCEESLHVWFSIFDFSLHRRSRINLFVVATRFYSCYSQNFLKIIRYLCSWIVDRRITNKIISQWTFTLSMKHSSFTKYYWLLNMLMNRIQKCD